jgi:hypothetical protein
MAHFAKLDENNIVLAVHVVNNDVITVNGVESEQAGIDFLTNLHGHSNWKQTSYTASIRKNYAGIGYKYDASLDAFVSPSPFPSWELDQETCQWKAPVEYPNDGKMYSWFEPNRVWIEVSSTVV